MPDLGGKTMGVPETAADEAAIRELYRRVLAGWNARDAEAFAAPFAEDGDTIGFDGSRHAGRADIATTIGGIFAHHPTGRYIGKMRRVRFIAPGAAILDAVAGLIPAGQADIRPDLNAVQTLVAAKTAAGWRIALYQNTPAQYHGRPERAEALTEELRQLL
jgi:uncharacterized protein (TIGR02246 family)